MIGDPDLPHTWTDVVDVARTLVAVSARPDPWGRVWHAPSNPPGRKREALTDVLAAEGRPPVAVRGIPAAAMTVGARLSPMMAELKDVSDVFTRPYAMDSTKTQEELELTPSAWSDICLRTAEGN